MWTVLKALLEFMTVLLLFHVLVFFGHKACGNLSSLTRDWTHIPCIGRWSLNRWTTREVPNLLFTFLFKAVQRVFWNGRTWVVFGKIIQKQGLLWRLRWWRICLQCGGTWVQSLGQEVSLEKDTAIHFSVLAWRSPWTEEPGRIQSRGSQRIGHDWTTNTFYFLSPEIKK